jgi:transcriptional regulator with XRE-family HTH domain
MTTSNFMRVSLPAAVADRERRKAERLQAIADNADNAEALRHALARALQRTDLPLYQIARAMGVSANRLRIIESRTARPHFSDEGLARRLSDFGDNSVAARAEVARIASYKTRKPNGRPPGKAPRRWTLEDCREAHGAAPWFASLERACARHDCQPWHLAKILDYRRVWTLAPDCKAPPREVLSLIRSAGGWLKAHELPDAVKAGPRVVLHDGLTDEEARVARQLELHPMRGTSADLKRLGWTRAADIARVCGVSREAARQWLTDARPVPVKHMQALRNPHARAAASLRDPARRDASAFARGAASLRAADPLDAG